MNELKQRALKAISEANITAAISHMENMGINCNSFFMRYSHYTAIQEKVRSEKRTYTAKEAEIQSEKFRLLAWDMIQAVNGTNKPMPEYLK